MPTNTGPLHLFEGFGIELEYMLVDNRNLDIRPIADEVIKSVAGEYVSEVEVGDARWSNELVLHVIEIKTNGPSSAIFPLADVFQRHVRQINEILAGYDSLLMPGAMHPWMDPFRETKLWPHEYNAVFEAYDRIFDCRGHGWSNLQSLHINLPFYDDKEFAQLHAAIRLLLPLLPALAASSPIKDSRTTGLLDNRMQVYRGNSARIPSLAGHIIPEPVFSEAEYHERILHRLYSDIKPFDPEGILQHEWLNSRGAIARFERNTIELRVIDIQECPAADLAIAIAVEKVLKALIAERWTSLDSLMNWSETVLEEIFLETIRDADEAILDDRHFLETFGWKSSGRCRAGDLWAHLIDSVFQDNDGRFRDHLNVILSKGTLARRMLAAVDNDFSRKNLRNVYRSLCDCLSRGEMFLP